MILESTCTFLSFEIELFMAVVSDVNWVTVSMDSSLSGDQIRYRLKKTNEIKDYFIVEIRERQVMNKGHMLLLFIILIRP